MNPSLLKLRLSQLDKRSFGIAGGVVAAILASAFGLWRIFRHPPAYLSPNPSELGKTESELYYYFATPGMPRETEATRLGTQAHRLIESIARSMGAETEVRIDTDVVGLHITGYADIVYPQGIVSDVKSLSSWKYRKVEEEGPIRKHIEQVNLYALALGKKYAMLEYVDRTNLSRRRTFLIEANEDMARATIARYNRVRKRIEYELDRGILKRRMLRRDKSIWERWREKPPPPPKTPDEELDAYLAMVAQYAQPEPRQDAYRDPLNDFMIDPDMGLRMYRERNQHSVM